MLLGNASTQTTEKYLGMQQNLRTQLGRVWHKVLNRFLAGIEHAESRCHQRWTCEVESEGGGLTVQHSWYA